MNLTSVQAAHAARMPATNNAGSMVGCDCSELTTAAVAAVAAAGGSGKGERRGRNGTSALPQRCTNRAGC
jgi:hypothetical protein